MRKCIGYFFVTKTVYIIFIDTDLFFWDCLRNNDSLRQGMGLLWVSKQGDFYQKKFDCYTSILTRVSIILILENSTRISIYFLVFFLRFYNNQIIENDQF